MKKVYKISAIPLALPLIYFMAVFYIESTRLNSHFFEQQLSLLIGQQVKIGSFSHKGKSLHLKDIQIIIQKKPFITITEATGAYTQDISSLTINSLKLKNIQLVGADKIVNISLSTEKLASFFLHTEIDPLIIEKYALSLIAQKKREIQKYLSHKKKIAQILSPDAIKISSLDQMTKKEVYKRPPTFNGLLSFLIEQSVNKKFEQVTSFLDFIKKYSIEGDFIHKGNLTIKEILIEQPASKGSSKMLVGRVDSVSNFHKISKDKSYYILQGDYDVMGVKGVLLRVALMKGPPTAVTLNLMLRQIQGLKLLLQQGEEKIQIESTQDEALLTSYVRGQEISHQLKLNLNHIKISHQISSALLKALANDLSSKQSLEINLYRKINLDSKQLENRFKVEVKSGDKRVRPLENLIDKMVIKELEKKVYAYPLFKSMREHFMDVAPPSQSGP